MAITENFNMHASLEYVRDELRGVWRYRWTGVLVAWLVAFGGWMAVYAMPDVYEARARVFVDTSTVLRPLLQGLAIDSGVQSQLDLVRQALLSRPQLERVALKTDLLAGATNPVEREKLLEVLRQQIKLTGDSSRSGDNLYTVSYQATSRDKSVSVVRVVLDSFMEDVIGKKQAGQATAQRFLRDEIQQYERRLSEGEARLADFKKKNMGLMPGDQGDYFTRMQSETEDLENVKAQLRLAERKRAQLAVQLSGESPSVSAGQGSGLPVTTESAAMLRESQARLQDLLLRFTDKHPEVIALREQIKQLEERRTREEDSFRRLAASGRASAASMNPVYQRLQVDLNATEVEIATLNGAVADRTRRIDHLKSLVNTAPEIEAELARLNRDYGITKLQYDSLVQRLETARLSERADETGVVKFDVIDPPVATLEPIAPNRILLLTAALIGGLAAGAGVAFLRHFSKPMIHSARQLQALSSKAHVVVLGLTAPSSWRANMVASRRRLALATGTLLVTFGVVLATQSTVTHWVQDMLR
jgi:polysaccharide chain length determinant protein (PEP-CTERM system associated)